MPRPALGIARARWPIHVLIGVSIVAAFGGSVIRLVQGLTLQAVAGFAMVVVAGAVWRLWTNERQQKAASLVLALCGIGLLAMVDALGFPMVFTALILLVLDWGIWLGIVVSLLISGLMVGLLHQAYGDQPGGVAVIVGQTVSNTIQFSLVLIVAVLLRAFNAQHAELVTVNAQLTEAMDASRDLVLATERARAAADLHDGLGYQLTLISMSLEYADRMREKDAELAWDEVANASATARQALADMRLWVRALHPARLDQLTEPSSFEAVADVFRGTGLNVEVEVSTDEQLDARRTLFAYRLIQEGLTNALRHARASQVLVTITQDEAGGLRLVVADNGSGSSKIRPGYGLRGLIERAEALGGRLRLQLPGSLGGLDLIAELPEVSS